MMVTLGPSPEFAHPPQDRDGGPFAAGAVCPWCNVGDVHYMRAPNPEAPRVTYRGSDDVDVVQNALGEVVLTIRDLDQHDRWDERPFAVVRTCRSCKYEWGQT